MGTEGRVGERRVPAGFKRQKGYQHVPLTERYGPNGKIIGVTLMGHIP